VRWQSPEGAATPLRAHAGFTKFDDLWCVRFALMAYPFFHISPAHESGVAL